MINDALAARVEGSHWVSEVNFDPEVRDQFDFPDPLQMIDSTLRKTRYTAGATVTTDGFLRIAAALAEVGIRHESLNVNWHGRAEPNPREFELARETLAGEFGFTTNLYADALLGNGAAEPVIDPRSVVDRFVEIGGRVIAPGIVAAPTPAAEARQFADLVNLVDYSASVGMTFTVTFAQVGRRDFGAMLRAANHAVALGATRLDLMDSTSSLSPEAMKVFVRRLRAGLTSPVPITMHPHDDFGMATASAIAAATAGASPDVSVNGVSYRCGFAALEQVVLSLEVLYGVHTGIDVSKLQWLSDVVAQESGIAVAPLKPVTGRYAYLKHTPMDVLTVLRDGPDAFPPISGCVSAAVTGAAITWVWDSLSTPAMAAELGRTLGFELTEAEALAVQAALDSAVAARLTYPRWLASGDAESILQTVVTGLRSSVEAPDE